jgi:prolyl-tRNA synthetase
MGATVTGPDGKEIAVHMGSYGIGPTRLVPAVIEASHDEAGIVWPVSVAPFEVMLINLKAGDPETDAAADTLYRALEAAGIEVLYDDRDLAAGAKFTNADLVGIPSQLIHGPRGLKDGKAEIKHRRGGERETLPLEAAVGRLDALIKPQRRDRVGPPRPQRAGPDHRRPREPRRFRASNSWSRGAISAPGARTPSFRSSRFSPSSASPSGSRP